MNDKNYEQSKGCLIQSLLDGEWRRLNHHRIRPVPFTEGSKVIVMGGTTSNINSVTGCRDTQEVFDRDKPTAGWVVETIVENVGCHRLSQRIWIDCPIQF